MNTRIQVEHPITEAITGVDMVKAQLRIASGDRLAEILPAKLEIRGHAIECRINAEHPRKFTPSAGQITAFNVPGGNGVRVDTAQYAEGVIPPYYDSLIAKLIVHGCDRAEAIAKMERALSQFVVQGVETSITLHQEIFQQQGFRAGEFDTGFMERFLAARVESWKRELAGSIPRGQMVRSLLEWSKCGARWVAAFLILAAELRGPYAGEREAMKQV